MASVTKTVVLDSPVEEVWPALREVGALATRLVPGFVLDTVVDGDTRQVTFANGLVVRERIVAVDEAARRVAYTVVDGVDGIEHHHAAAQVSAEGAGTRFTWVTDVLPDALAGRFSDAMDAGVAAVSRAFSRESSHGTVAAGG